MELIKTEKRDEFDRKEREQNLYKKFFARLFRDKARIFAIVGLMFLTSLLYVSIPFVLKEGVQRLYLIQKVHYVLILAIVLILANLAITLIKERQVVNFSYRLVNEVKKDLYRGILKKSITKFKRIGVGKVLAFLSYNVSLIKSLVSEWGTVAVQQTLNFLAIFIASFFVDIRLSLLFFAMIPVFIIYLVIVQYIVRNYALQLMTFNKQIFENSYQTLSDFENMKILNTEERRLISFSRILDRDMNVRIQRVLIYQYNKIILHAISLLLIIAFIGIGGQYLNQQEMSFSEFVFFVLYIHLLFRPFEVTLFMSSYFEAGKIGIKTVFPYIATQDFQRIKNIRLKGHISIHDARYRHPRSKFKLKKINLEVRAGERITILGDNNSGKSSFVQMLLHLRKLSFGRIYFDRKMQRELGARTIRNNVAILSRDYLLSNGTIFNFLTSGQKRKMANFDEKLVFLCQEMGLNDKIIGLDARKYQAKISNQDIRFSETEKLKLALVRAVYQDAPILLLDNFWHSFDPKTKQEVKNFIERHCDGRTIIQFSSNEDDLLIESERKFSLNDGKLDLTG